MKIIPTKLKDCVIIEPKVFGDSRGFFLEIFQEKRYKEMAGINLPFVQDNYSHSKKGVLRGLHYQKIKPQGKLVRVIKGKVFDVVVDLRRQSPTFGLWDSVELSEENFLQMWVPPGCAHGFYVISEYADFEYKCTDYYDPNDEGSIHWNDPDLKILWPDTSNLLISSKDNEAPFLKAIKF